MQEHDDKDEDVAALLGLAGARDTLPADLQARWESRVRKELAVLRARRGKRAARRRTLAMSLCAGIAALAVSLLSFFQDDPAPGPLITVVHVEGQHRFSTAGDEPIDLLPGDVASAGTEASTGSAAYLALTYRGYDLRLNSNTRLHLGREALRLLAGEIFLKETGDGRLADPEMGVVIDTPYGSVRDIGTQFTVALRDGRTLATVRRGTVEVSSGSRHETVSAKPGAALRATLQASGPIEIDVVANSGIDWAWIHRAVETYAIEGNSAFDFLRWVARETGQELVFVTPAAERLAQMTVLHGHIAETDPARALRPVLSSTDLVALVSDDGELRVSRSAPRGKN